MSVPSIVLGVQKKRAFEKNTSSGQVWQDRFFHGLTWFFAFLVTIFLGGILVSLFLESIPAFMEFGLDFVIRQEWDPVGEEYGALIPVFGTITTSIIALLIAVPLSFGIAMFLTELCPVWLKRPMGLAVELLAGIPSIIYGMWGLFVLVPLFAEYVQPGLTFLLGWIPVMGTLFSGSMMGIGILTAGVVLALMIIPFISSIMRDVFETVPAILKESAYALGCTRWEVVRQIVLHHSRNGVVGGIMLGLGRALGETMAVTFVIGNAHRIPASLYAPGNSITSTLANEFAEAASKLHVSSLFALGLILFVITFAVLSLAKLMLLRMSKKEGLA